LLSVNSSTYFICELLLEVSSGDSRFVQYDERGGRQIDRPAADLSVKSLLGCYRWMSPLDTATGWRFRSPTPSSTFHSPSATAIAANYSGSGWPRISRSRTTPWAFCRWRWACPSFRPSSRWRWATSSAAWCWHGRPPWDGGWLSADVHRTPRLWPGWRLHSGGAQLAEHGGLVHRQHDP